MTDEPTSSDPGPDVPEAPDSSGDDGIDDPPGDSRPPLVSWPPPGLERMQGDLWGVVTRLGVGGAIFTLPLLAALTLSIDPWRTGIYGDAWWIVLITSAVGIWILMAGYVQLFRALRRWRAAVHRGYAPRTVALVLADRPGDTGFMVQGARAHSMIDAGTRGRLLTGRLFQVGLLVAAGLWLSAGFVLGVLLSARGMLSEGALATATLVPPALAVAAVIVVRAWENGRLRKARKEWFAQSWTEDLSKAEIEKWHEKVATRSDPVPLPRGKPDPGGASLRAGAVVTVALGLGVLLVSVPLVTLSGVGPTVGAVSWPSDEFRVATVEKAASLEVLDSLRLSTDPEITPLEAGEALHSLTAPPSGPAGALMKDPPRAHPPIFAEDELSEISGGVRAGPWSAELISGVADGLEPDVVAYLEELGAHPAVAELDVLARAGSLDEVGAAYRLPFPEDLAAHEIPIPKYSQFRRLAYAQVAAAAGEAARGRMDAAEMRLRKIISAGLLLGREGQTLITSLVGIVVANTGAEALADLYEATGRSDQAAALREARRIATHTAEVGASMLGAPDLGEMTEVVTDTTVIRGVRWEHFWALTAVGPCLNLNRMVFGPPEGHAEWIRRVRETLVLHESEEEALRVLLRGWGGAGERDVVSRLFSQVIGEGTGTCAALAEAVL